MRAKGGPINAPRESESMYRRKGGCVERAKGGGVKSGPAWNEGVRSGTQPQHVPAKEPDIENMYRPRPVTFKSGGKVKSFMARAKGGPVESNYRVDSATRLPGGGGGAAARLEKIKSYGYGKPMKGHNQAR
jgi:hypothetical protein